MAVYLAVADDVTSAILYREVPHMLHAKYQPNWPNGRGVDGVLFCAVFFPTRCLR